MTFDPESFVRRGTEVIPQAVKDATGEEDHETVALFTCHLTKVAGCFGARRPEPVVFRESDRNDPLLPVAYAVMRRIADRCGGITVGELIAAPEDGDGRDLRFSRKFFIVRLDGELNGTATNGALTTRSNRMVRAKHALELSPEDFEEVNAAEREDEEQSDDN